MFSVFAEFFRKVLQFACDALRKVPFQKCSDEYHFDSEILVQFKLAGLRVVERTIPTYYGDEKCYVNIWKYGIDVLRTMGQYWLHQKGSRMKRCKLF